MKRTWFLSFFFIFNGLSASAESAVYFCSSEGPSAGYERIEAMGIYGTGDEAWQSLAIYTLVRGQESILESEGLQFPPAQVDVRKNADEIVFSAGRGAARLDIELIESRTHDRDSIDSLLARESDSRLVGAIYLGQLKFRTLEGDRISIPVRCSLGLTPRS